MTSNLLSSLQAKGKGRPTPRSLRETMEAVTLQRMLHSRLEAAESGALRKAGISAKYFEERCTRLAQNDLEVKQLVAGLRQMHEDSVQGILPLLPGLELPEELTQERVLQILHKIQRLKEQKFREILQSTSDKELSSEGATPVITSQLQDSNTEAETAVLKEEELLLQHERQQKQNAPSQQQLVLTPLIFLQAIAVHSRDPEFKAKKAAIDQNHSERIFDLLRRGRTLDPIVAVCHKRLQQSSWPEFALRLESCEGMDAFILCLVSPATSSGNSNDVSAPLGLLEEFSAFLDEAESLNLELDSLAAVCLDSETLPETGEKYAPVREAVYRHGHCFALFKGESLQGVSSRVDAFKSRLTDALGSGRKDSNSPSGADDRSSEKAAAAAAAEARGETPDITAAAAAGSVATAGGNIGETFWEERAAAAAALSSVHTRAYVQKRLCDLNLGDTRHATQEPSH
ncbi:uncharacterized protein LOC34621720 [Cyclospora cayetanensis]|uniref:Uncharacterized protein LOC34621720 n=1 Tax=Cyclospora cayetanensis TaxID=88456 RepID=A0A6P6RZI1_9EIME|nr:uncharacterized protein LOC34621720 [Cyclospora cayetanensis]